jgi:hypothetical protein
LPRKAKFDFDNGLGSRLATRGSQLFIHAESFASIIKSPRG